MSATKYKAYTDPELIASCLKGDALAWEALIMRYRRLIFSVPVRFGFGEADASDVFQSVCVKLLEHLGEIKDDRKISGWLITTTMRQCLHLKSQRGRETPTADTNLSDPEDPSLNLEELRIVTEQQQALREAVEGLAVRCKVLVHLLYFDNRSPSYDQISNELGIPVASIGPTRARCLDKLRSILRRRRIRGAEAGG